MLLNSIFLFQLINYLQFDCVIFKIVGSSKAACCVGEWDSKCWDTQGDYNFNHACNMCVVSYCSGPCNGIGNGGYNSSLKYTEACATCCRTYEHETDWNCDAGKI